MQTAATPREPSLGVGVGALALKACLAAMPGYPHRDAAFQGSLQVWCRAVVQGGGEAGLPPPFQASLVSLGLGVEDGKGEPAVWRFTTRLRLC